MSRHRSGSVLDTIKGFVDKEVKAQLRADELNVDGGLKHYFAKSMDKKTHYFIRVEPEGIRYAVRPMDEHKHDVAQLKKDLDAAPLIKYVSWVRFKLDPINDTISIWVKVPKDGGAAPSSSKKSKKKKEKDSSTSPDAIEMVDHELAFSCHQTADFKKEAYKFMEEIKSKGGAAVRDRSASAAPARNKQVKSSAAPPKPEFNKETVPKGEPEPESEAIVKKTEPSTEPTEEPKKKKTKSDQASVSAAAPAGDQADDGAAKKKKKKTKQVESEKKSTSDSDE